MLERPSAQVEAADHPPRFLVGRPKLATHDVSGSKDPIHHGTAEGSHYPKADEHDGRHQLKGKDRVLGVSLLGYPCF